MEPRLRLDSVPVILGRYQLLKRIAVGGMAEIYLAKDTGFVFEKLCVVKRILPQLGDEPHLVQMFLDEARVAATLQHPNIVSTLDVGDIGGEYYISMEYLDGEDCRALYKAMRRKGTKLPYEIALGIVIEAARGLHYAHEKIGYDGRPLSIVHRDVTPHNVFITYDGVVKLLDFGVAKAANRESQTTAGMLKGKIPYMSPEQCRGVDLDRRSDIYAIGILLYELTTGVRLYASSTATEFETMRRIVEDQVEPPSMQRMGYPPALEAIVLRCLAKDPHERFQTAEALQHAVEELVRSMQLPVSSISLGRFMRENFREHAEVWRSAGGDETKLIDAIAAKISESSDLNASPDGHELSEGSQSHGRTPSVVGELVPTYDGITSPGEYEGYKVAPVDVIAAAAPRKRRWSVAMFIVFGIAVALGITIGVTSANRVGDGGEGTRTAAASGAAEPSAEPEQKASAEAETEPAPAAEPAATDNGAREPTKPAAEPEGEPEGAPAPAPEPAADPAPAAEAKQTAPAADRERERPAADRRARRPDPDDEDLDENDPPDGAAARKPAVTGVGELRIAATPSCELEIDGRAVGSTPRVVRDLKAGKHRIRLRNSKFDIDRSYTIWIEPNKALKKRYDFSND